MTNCIRIIKNHRQIPSGVIEPYTHMEIEFRSKIKKRNGEKYDIRSPSVQTSRRPARQNIFKLSVILQNCSHQTLSDVQTVGQQPHLCYTRHIRIPTWFQ